MVLNMPVRIRDLGIPQDAINEIAYETYIKSGKSGGKSYTFNEKENFD